MTGFHLPPRYFREDAVRHFTRPRWYRLFGLLGRAKPPVASPVPGTRTLPRLECLWMPCWLVEFVTELRGEVGVVCVCVDAWTGFIVLSERREALRAEPPPGDSFPPQIPAERAEELARKGLFQMIMRRRGQLAKPHIREISQVLLFHAPYWVYYHRASGGRVGVTLMDAYTGNPCGGQVRQSVLNALVDRRRRSLEGADPGV